MSISSLGIVGSLASSSLVQRGADVEKTERDTADANRAAEAVARAERAAGIGQTEEDAATSERDADGRRLWERPEDANKPTEEAVAEETTAPVKDPTGQSGGLLDISG